MIVSISRRTDVPAYYSDWLFRRLREGYALVRNPVNPRQVSRVGLRPEEVDGLVFWTKNPLPLLDRLKELDAYSYYVQFTLTAYGRDVEPRIPAKGSVLVPAFQRLAQRLGPERVIWRYDPIFLSRRYTMGYHLRYFEVLAHRLAPYTRRCTISFLDYYRNTARNMAALEMTTWLPGQREELAAGLAASAERFGLALDTCAEALDLSPLGVGRAKCVDAGLLGRLSGRPLTTARDKHQRPACGCASSVDIGAYRSCPGGCLYCYASPNPRAALRGRETHHPDSPLLLGTLRDGDVVRDRRDALQDGQLLIGDLLH